MLPYGWVHLFFGGMGVVKILFSAEPGCSVLRALVDGSLNLH